MYAASSIPTATARGFVSHASTWTGCVVGVLLSVCGPHLGHTQPLAPSDEAEPPMEVYLTVHYETIVHTLISARYYEEAIYLPMGELFNLLQVNWTWDAATGRGTGFFIDQDQAYELDTQALSASIGNRFVPVAPTDVLPEPLEVYVYVGLLERLFGLTSTVDMGKLDVRIDAEATLPVLANEQRRKRRHNLYDPLAALQHSPLRYTQRSSPGLEGGVIDYKLSRSRAAQRTIYTLDADVGMRILGGAASLSLLGMTTYPGFISRAEPRWTYLFHHQPLVSRIELGTLSGSGRRGHLYRGLALTNAPPEPELMLGTYPIEGEAGPGWDVELYIDEQLANFGRADETGTYRFAIPMLYGTTMARVRSYGPTGEIEEKRLRLQIPHTFLRPGTFRYALQAGRTHHNEGRPVAYASAGLGLTTWLTAHAELDYAPDSLHARPIPRGRLSARVGTPYLLSLEAGSDEYRATLDGYFPSQAVLQLAYTHFASHRVRRLDARDAEWQASLYVPIERAPVPLGMRLRHTFEQYDQRSIMRLFGGIQTSVGALSMTLDAQHRVLRRHTSARTRSALTRLSGTVSYDLAGRRLRLLKNTRLEVRTRYAWGQPHLTDLRLDLGRTTRRFGQFRLSVTPPLAQRSASVGLRFTYDFRQARITTATTTTFETVGTHTTSIRGSLQRDPITRRLLLHNRQGVDRGGAAVRLFVDHNGDGQRNDQEPIVERARVRVEGGQRVAPERRDAARFLGLRPGVRYDVAIDPASIPNPMWIPEEATFSFRAESNTLRTLEIPLFVAGAGEGAVFRIVEGTRVPLAGVKVHVRRLEGTFERTEVTFSDGTFYILSLPPGTYEATVDADQLARLGVHSDPAVLTFTIAKTEFGDYVDGLIFELRDDP